MLKRLIGLKQVIGLSVAGRKQRRAPLTSSMTERKSSRSLGTILGTFVVIMAVISPSGLSTDAYAASNAINQAKAQCIIGEQNDGYLGVVAGKTASASLKREIAAINQRRKAAYSRLASQNGVTIRDTGKVAAEKLIARAGSGECVQDANGRWIKKR